MTSAYEPWFSLLGGYGWSYHLPSTSQKFDHSPNHEKSLTQYTLPSTIGSFPPQNNNFHVSSMKPSFLAVVIAPVLFPLGTS